jgi:hypothetical protein
MARTLARWLSILGHPALLVPCAAALGIALADGPPRWSWLALPVAIAAGTMLHAGRQVRRGAWQHVDASRPEERRGLQVVLALLLAGIGFALQARGGSAAPVAALHASAGILVVAVLAARWCKVSLHTAFAVLASALPWPHLAACLPLALLALAVAWSRHVLGRHTVPDLAVGLLAGGAAAAWIVHAGID